MECCYCHLPRRLICRSLCRSCWSNRAVRRRFPAQKQETRLGRPDGRGLQLPPPTAARPGTAEKIAVFEMRAVMGYKLFHPLDGALEDER